MTQADTHISTRRAFLSTAAGVAAAATVAPAALAMTPEDPTFARIEPTAPPMPHTARLAPSKRGENKS